MINPTPPDERRKAIWACVYQDLLQNAVPDSRFHFDFLSYTPDFRNSSAAINHVTGLLCYKSACTILITSDNSLEALRHRALKDGKKIIVATYRLRRGFVLLEPSMIGENKLELAACLDGMEKHGLGRAVSLTQLRDEGVSIDMCAIGGLAFNERGVIIWEGHALFEVQWALLQDIRVLGSGAPIVAVAHACQVVDEAQLRIENITPGKTGEVQCDFVVTPDRIYEIDGAIKHVGGIDFDFVDPEALSNIPPLQELKGIRMMERIMASRGVDQDESKKVQKPQSDEEQRGISIVEKLMKGYGS